MFEALLFWPIILLVCIWAIFAYVVVSVAKRLLNNNGLAKKTITALLVLGFIWIPLWRVFPGLPLANHACKADGGARLPAPLATEGIFRTKGMRWYGNTSRYDFSQIVDDLVVKKFRFVEEEQGSGGNWDLLRRTPYGSGSRLIRFYLDSAHAPACAEFEQALAQKPGLMAAIRMKGLPASLCIAAEKSDTVMSNYTYSFNQYSSGFPAFIEWKELNVTDNGSSVTAARYKYFNYAAIGGGYGGSTLAGTSCYNDREHDDFVKRVFVPAETNQFLEKRGISVQSALWEFYKPENKQRIRIVNHPDAGGNFVNGSAVITAARQTNYGTSFKAIWQSVPNDDANDEVRTGDGYLFITRGFETRKITLPSSQTFHYNLPNNSEPMQLFREIALMQIADGVITLASTAAPYGRASAIVEYDFDGRLIRNVEFEFPKIEWKGTVPRKYFKSLRKRPNGYEIVVLDTSGHPESLTVVGEYVVAVDLRDR